MLGLQVVSPPVALALVPQTTSPCCAAVAAGGARSCGSGAREAAAADAPRGHACTAATRPSGSGQPAEKPPAAYQVGSLGLPSWPRFLGCGKGAARNSHCWWLKLVSAVLGACGGAVRAVKGGTVWKKCGNGVSGGSQQVSGVIASCSASAVAARRLPEAQNVAPACDMQHRAGCHP